MKIEFVHSLKGIANAILTSSDYFSAFFCASQTSLGTFLTLFMIVFFAFISAAFTNLDTNFSQL